VKIGWKLAIALTVPLVTLTVVLGYLFQVRSRELLRGELAREGRAIARVVQLASEDYLRDRQVADLQELAERIAGYERVLGVRLFDEHGRLTYQSVSLDPYPFIHYKELGRALSERRTFETRRRIGGEPVVGFIVPLSNRRGAIAGAVQVLQLESYIEEDARATRDFILMLTLCMLAATIGVVLLVTRFSIGRPIEDLVRRFREVGGREVPTPLAVRGRDELSLLSREFNGMCERLDRTRQSLVSEQEQRRQMEMRLRNSERLAGLGRLAAGLAHEIGTPLNVISGRAESIRRRGAQDESTQKGLGIIVSQTDRIVRIVRDMLDFARVKTPRRIETRLLAVIETATDALEESFRERSVTVSVTSDSDSPTLLADPDRLQQVFLNLLNNAADAMPEGGRIRIHCSRETVQNPERPGPARDCLVVTISDEGAGIRPEDRVHVFDPFFTTKDAGSGTGLGLAVSYGIVEEHGGWFDLESEVSRGTRVTVHLPIHPEEDTLEEAARA
jgi:signal transduction histidine kinase